MILTLRPEPPSSPRSNPFLLLHAFSYTPSNNSIDMAYPQRNRNPVQYAPTPGGPAYGTPGTGSSSNLGPSGMMPNGGRVNYCTYGVFQLRLHPWRIVFVPSGNTSRTRLLPFTRLCFYAEGHAALLQLPHAQSTRTTSCSNSRRVTDSCSSVSSSRRPGSSDSHSTRLHGPRTWSTTSQPRCAAAASARPSSGSPSTAIFLS